MGICYVAVGSNLGDRQLMISEAKKLVSEHPSVSGLESAALLETRPLPGGPDQGDYLNTVWRFETTLVPEELLLFLQEVESKLGRERLGHYAPRTIDLDILFLDDVIMNTESLTLPHPRLHERDFILECLNELDPDWVHPVLEKTVKELVNSYETN